MCLGQPDLLAARQQSFKFLQACFWRNENTGFAISPVRLSTSNYHIPKYLIKIDKICCDNRKVNVRVNFILIKDSFFMGGFI
jgi:G:T-mismatch repair DNA endonuclease (very short patch repair protein)